jgi:hypothetical protein
VKTSNLTQPSQLTTGPASRCFSRIVVWCYYTDMIQRIPRSAHEAYRSVVRASNATNVVLLMLYLDNMSWPNNRTRFNWWLCVLSYYWAYDNGADPICYCLYAECY